ncbi:polyphosphate kinase 1 [Fructilactobacillus lindneri]|uniref:polyphosphate kinase 1 n=1 Tax=Fructilactobacillus lindneri TaxID=53444 RepID=UPI000CD46586|nr:polyphosphate kinase 1 [Fructilactobacillus lindneri]POH08508.1 polyphosphate kinase 1 [Fructilactobacillus lindneri]
MINEHNNTGNCYNRDLSWLLFNRRVIDLANENTTPFLDRFKFLAIASNNLDEFYSVRVPSLQSQMELTDDGVETKSGMEYSKILKKVHKRNEKNFKIQYGYFQQLSKELAENKMGTFAKYRDLNEHQQEKADQLFDQRILPFLSFTTYDTRYSLDYLKNKRIALGVLIKKDNKKKIRIVPIPTNINRLIKLNFDGIDHYLLVEDLIRNNLTNLFDDGKIEEIITFRIIRDLDASLDVEKDDNNKDTIRNLRHYLADREKGRITMFEVEETDDLNLDFLKSFLKKFKVNKRTVYPIDGPLDLTFLFSLVKPLAKQYPKLVYPPLHAVQWNQSESMLKYLDQHDLLLQYPYDSFDQFLTFLRAAIDDPKTVAIKQTIYRVANHSKVIELLKEAAQKGIKVTVMIELRARFDEANNLKVTGELEDAGCNIVFGKKYMKVHSKTCLVLTEDGLNPKGYVQIGTGNYNESTATGFVDLSLFSSRDDYVKDLASFFNYLEQPVAEPPKYKVLTASPHRIEDMVIQNIQTVKEYYLRTGKGHVFLKVNSLTDVDVIAAIYDAATVGVPFRLVVRGACCLKLGICGPKEKIVVSSIVGEFLEHSRIYAFYDDDTSLWISSADLMTRNMDNRVELAAPILSPKLKKLMQHIIDVYEQDDVDGFFMNKKGKYFKYASPKGKSAQQTFIKEIDEPHEKPEKPRQSSKDVKIPQKVFLTVILIIAIIIILVALKLL